MSNIAESSMSNIAATCLSEGIDWKFISPRSPTFGGLWKAAVKASKFHSMNSELLSTKYLRFLMLVHFVKFQKTRIIWKCSHRRTF